MHIWLLEIVKVAKLMTFMHGIIVKPAEDIESKQPSVADDTYDRMMTESDIILLNLQEYAKRCMS